MQTVNMSSKCCCVLAVVCLSVILLSLDADAQPTVDDEIVTCDFAMPEEVANSVKTIASNQQLMKDELTDVRKIASDLQRNIEEIRDELAGVKRQPADCGCASAKSTTVNPIHTSTQSTHGTSCLVLIIVKRSTEYHANEIGSLTLATRLSANVLSKCLFERVH